MHHQVCLSIGRSSVCKLSLGKSREQRFFAGIIFPEGKGEMWRSAVLLSVMSAVAAEKAKGAISWSEAKCIMKDRKIIFLGDSNSRFHSFVFNVFLETGDLRDDDYEKRGSASALLLTRAQV